MESYSRDIFQVLAPAFLSALVLIGCSSTHTTFTSNYSLGFQLYKGDKVLVSEVEGARDPQGIFKWLQGQFDRCNIELQYLPDKEFSLKQWGIQLPGYDHTDTSDFDRTAELLDVDYLLNIKILQRKTSEYDPPFDENWDQETIHSAKVGFEVFSLEEKRKIYEFIAETKHLPVNEIPFSEEGKAIRKAFKDGINKLYLDSGCKDVEKLIRRRKIKL